MNTLTVEVITPTSKVVSGNATKVQATTAEGDVTILPQHANYFALLTQGIVTVHMENGEEETIAVDRGFLETDGKKLSILVSRAYGETEVDEHKVQEALERAREDIKEAKGKAKEEAEVLLRRSLIDMKLLKRKKH